MNKIQQEEYIEISEESQQVRFRLELPIQIVARRDDFLRQVSAQLEELDYRQLYHVYSGRIRKSQVEPRIMFKILVCAYAKGVYTSRKIEELCRENIQFILMLDGQRVLDHCAIARFRSGKYMQAAIETCSVSTPRYLRNAAQRSMTRSLSTEQSWKAAQTGIPLSGERPLKSSWPKSEKKQKRCSSWKKEI